MPTSWIQPTQNSFMDTFGQVQQLKAQNAQNALYAAKAAELPYERERAEALNVANIGKAEAQARKAEADTQGSGLDNALKKVEIGSQILAGVRDEGSYQWARKRATVEQLGTEDWPPNFDPAWVQQTQQKGMQLKDQLAQQLNEQKFTEQQKQSGIDNQFQQGNLDVARTNAATSQANAAETRRYHGVMENKPASGFSMTTNPDGTMTMTSGPGAKPLTESSAKHVLHGSVAADANQDMDQLRKEGYDPTGLQAYWDKFATDSNMTNWLASAQGQRQLAADEGFLGSIGYLRSGANVAVHERESAYKTFLNRPGDDDATQAAKAQKRALIVRAAEAGDPRLPDIVAGITGIRPGGGSVSNRTRTQSTPAPAQQPPGGEDPRAKLERLRALKAARGG